MTAPGRGSIGQATKLVGAPTRCCPARASAVGQQARAAGLVDNSTVPANVADLPGASRLAVREPEILADPMTELCRRPIARQHPFSPGAARNHVMSVPFNWVARSPHDLLAPARDRGGALTR
jgi:hypothetical protein